MQSPTCRTMLGLAGLVCLGLLVSVVHGATTIYVQAKSAQLRDGKTSLSKTVATVQFGEAIEVLRQEEDWLEIRTSGGAMGWIFANKTTPTKPSVAPGGYVFITKGLLKQIRNEAELAAVLGHEIGHISAKHILDILQRNKQLSGITEAGLAAAGRNPALFKGLIDQAAKKLLDEGLDQSKELESDRLGAVFAARAGYDPNAYVTLLQRLRTLKGDDQAFFKTHPNFSSRIEEVQASLRAFKQPLMGTLLAERYTRNVGRGL